MQQKLEIVYGKDVADKITSSKVLVVGAGGIGCELVKALSMSGFKDVAVIDLDTIDISNLNRQFLFRREHVGRSKSTCLEKAICDQNPHIKVQSYEGRIQESRFSYTFFCEFTIVINALDNVEARYHVNRMCFNLGIPLIEAGTKGYSASMTPILKGKTECY